MQLKNEDANLLENVSRETKEKLELYVSLLQQWNTKINLVSKQTIDQIWDRHILDSLQLASFIDPSVGSIADFGSGGGFPGLVLAIVTGIPITLIESDMRKTVFLREVARQTQANVNILCKRIEQVDIPSVDVITARALASLEILLSFSENRVKENGYCLFLKGRQVDDEIAEAQQNWEFDYLKIPSKTSSDGVIVKINQFRHIV
ncbi:16S rRNA G527 N7-methylase RsmG (former glucose-inhibited division protein B) (RsmG) (PDB:1XDZ) (PUBMED:15375115 [Commensalibacter communis]|uniref:Ribosomal RNA small subunit methyltransferase G n=1 Tax=Commensalibacter communis TaxID=2972786 RepID=A0A9W4XHT7_9PROT|nr:16S rRNA (guanine(527)-N(7))-methyltransferase RsmG [Commensalibacter communis]CAI3938360.1 16S rRNA G527 N7-methylase RsmG (former glucose-inhibited division protein B) (RsmG) (PDB:1XDZ) (PUBMED:15375115 [Commensalibacter communis]CAI3939891.1 16S rRNA G527 N7-methylase RsmG (former glucose-inhibited division protein B) (RsmG) (PDB:1XDZ) (PUBMED:15375115 [Commensalibacter communis]CAI3939916.1 16S rRNA G527 N7-methylase RsmG (former glucose-inhibited division protein B) (RsmG) (PDB:1XDZ) (PU